MIEHRYLTGRVYRHRRIVCADAGVTILRDARVAPEPPGRRHVSIRFLAGIDPVFGHELERLLDARGARGARLAETLEPIDIALPTGDRDQWVRGRLEPPIARNQPMPELDFRVREQAHG